MKKTILLSIFILVAASVQGQTFFQKAAGTWRGTLEYSDYRSGERVKLYTLLTIEPASDGNVAKFTYIYDDFGRVMKSTETQRIDPASRTFLVDNEKFSFEEKEGELILSGHAQDGNTEEPIRKTIMIDSDKLTILKESRTPFQFRNRYTFTRSPENTAPFRMLTPMQMAEDLAVLKKALIAIHPGIYRYNTPRQIEEKFAALERAILAPITEGEFYKITAQAISWLKCGHTFQNPLNQEKAIKSAIFNRRTFLPFYFKLIDLKMIVTGNISSKKLPIGSEITAINGTPVKQIIESLLTIAPADGENTLAHRINSLELTVVEENRQQLFDIFYPLFFPLPDSVFTIEAIDRASKKPVKFQVLATTRAERFEKTAAKYGKIPTFDDGWKFEMQGYSTALLQIGNSITWRLKTVEPKKFLAEAFAKMRRERAMGLIVDLRGNGGGDMEVGYELARYLARKKLPPYVATRRLVRSVSSAPEVSKYVDTYSDGLKEWIKNGLPVASYKPAKNGYFEILPSPDLESFPGVVPYENNFTGLVYIISDSSNASATFQFLEFAKDNKLGTIVGQESGGNRQGINGGNYFFLTLPNSRIEFDIPVYFQAPLKMQPDTGIVPDFVIEPSIDDIAAGVDTELKYTRRVIVK